MFIYRTLHLKEINNFFFKKPWPSSPLNILRNSVIYICCQRSGQNNAQIYKFICDVINVMAKVLQYQCFDIFFCCWNFHGPKDIFDSNIIILLTGDDFVRNQTCYTLQSQNKESAVCKRTLWTDHTTLVINIGLFVNL